MKSIDHLLAAWKKSPDIGPNIEYYYQQPPAVGSFGDYPEWISPVIQRALQEKGILQLYHHQRTALDFLSQGKNVVIATGTASGKSLCYHLPILDAIVKSSSDTALLIYPTKALTYDQYEFLEELGKLIHSEEPNARILPAVYDGDTPPSHRQQIRKNANIVLTNPDMLHTGILPHHTIWERFFQNLRFVVIDEIHTLRGVFGSHIANVIYRLRRLLNFYGSHPQFILTSATIANPREHAGFLTGCDFELVDGDSSPHGIRHWIIYNPPLIDPELGIRKGAVSETTKLIETAVAENVQTLCFSKTRRGVEVLVRRLYEQLPGLADKIRGYRSGYMRGERRKIEQGLREKKILVVAATNALELGIDIGNLDCVMLVGYPGTIASFRQRAGRAGRRFESAAAVLVASMNPIDQYMTRHPEYLFDRNPEKALIRPDNALIMLNHLQCAAFELRFHEGDTYGPLSAESLSDYLEYLTQTGLLHKSNSQYFWVSEEYPAQSISLRSSTGQSVLLTTAGTDELRQNIIGEVDLLSSYWMVHPGAVYLHDGQSYEVEKLDLDKKVATLRPAEPDYFTEPIQEWEISVISEQYSRKVPAAEIYLGDVAVTSQVVGYRRMEWQTNQPIDVQPLDLPSTELRTVGYWIVLDASVEEKLTCLGLWMGTPNKYGPNWERQKKIVRERDQFKCQACGIPEQGIAHHVHHKIPFRAFQNYLLANQSENLATLCPACHRKAEAAVRMRSGLTGVTYALSQFAPLHLMCDASDLGATSDYQAKFASGRPAIAVYDLVPDGIGLASELFQQHTAIIKEVLAMVSDCSCTAGCPACIGVGGDIESGGKAEAITILKLLNGLDIE